jgi:hypothetical protein
MMGHLTFISKLRIAFSSRNLLMVGTVLVREWRGWYAMDAPHAAQTAAFTRGKPALSWASPAHRQQTEIGVAGVQVLRGHEADKNGLNAAPIARPSRSRKEQPLAFFGWRDAL